MKKTAREIRQERTALVQSARAITNKAVTENRDLTPEERTSFDEIMGKIDVMEEDAKRLERVDGVEGELRNVLNPKQGDQQIDPNIGMSPEEVRQYSILRMIRAQVNNDWRDAGLERSASMAVAERMGRNPEGIFVPYDVLSAPTESKRAMTVAVVTDGGNLVADELRPASFIDVLRNRSVLAQAGATMMSGLVGDIPIPRQTATSTVVEKAETIAGDESTPTIDQVTLTPKLIKGWVEYSRQLMNQSSIDVEAFVRNDLAKALTTRIDLQALHGTGVAPFIKGIAATTGIGSVAGGTNGLIPTWANIIALETEIAIDNADIGSLAYITNAKVRGILKATPKVTGNPSFIWDAQAGNTPVNGYPALVSNLVSSTLTKGTSVGNCSAIFYGNWADMLIGLWGALDILVNPYAKDKEGMIRVNLFQMADMEVRHAESFAAMLDALTA